MQWVRFLGVLLLFAMLSSVASAQIGTGGLPDGARVALLKVYPEARVLEACPLALQQGDTPDYAAIIIEGKGGVTHLLSFLKRGAGYEGPFEIDIQSEMEPHRQLVCYPTAARTSLLQETRGRTPANFERVQAGVFCASKGRRRFCFGLSPRTDLEDFVIVADWTVPKSRPGPKAPLH